MKVITKEQMEKILATFLRNGYSVDSINDDTYQWYLGWMNYGEDRVTLPLEINLDNGSKSIVFMWWPHYTDYNRSEIIGYILGAMSQLMPDMRLRSQPSGDSNTIEFVFKEQEHEEQ